MGPLIAIAALIVLVLIGLPVGYVLGIVGLVGLISVIGLDPALASLPSTFIGSLGSYDLIAIPLFTLMGYVMFNSGVGSRIFDVAYLWFGHIRGGLAFAAVVGSALFGAVSGSAIAGSSGFRVR